MNLSLSPLEVGLLYLLIADVARFRDREQVMMTELEFI